MDFSVTIVTLNRADRLARGLRALAEQDFPKNNFEVIIADNGSTDETKAVADDFAAAFPNFRYLFDDRPGQMVGWHRALAEATGDITCFIDDDAEPAPGWLSGLADAYTNAAVGMATGPIDLVLEAEPPDWLDHLKLGEPGSQTLPFLGLLDCGDEVREVPGNFVWGTNFSVRRHLLIEVGGFHPCAMPASLLHFHGDGEIHVGREVSDRGHKVLYHPEAGVKHHIPAARLSLEAVSTKYRTTAYTRGFQTLRSTGEAYVMPGEEELDGMVHRYFREPDAAPAELHAAIMAGLRDGFRRHLDAFTGDPHFRDWVLRENYLDLDSCYVHPTFEQYRASAGDQTDWRQGD